MEELTDVGTEDGDVITLTKISRLDGLLYILPHGAPRADLWRAELRYYFDCQQIKRTNLDVQPTGFKLGL